MLGQSKKERKAGVKHALAQHRGDFNCYPMVGSLGVCKEAFLLLNGLENGVLKKLRHALKEERDGSVISHSVAEHGNMGRKKPSAATLACAAWINELAAAAGDVCPVTGKLHCFMFFCTATLFGLYNDSCNERGMANGFILGWSSFKKLVDKTQDGPYFYLVSNIKWKRAVTQKMCGTCVSLIEAKDRLLEEKVPFTDARWEEWRQKRKEHWFVASAERKHYSELRNSCRLGVVVNVLVLIMDASKPLMHLRRFLDTAEGRKIWQIKGGFIGLLDHSNGCGLVWLSAGPGPLVGGNAEEAGDFSGQHASWEGTDVNLSLLLSYIRARHNQGRMQRHLHLQLDGGADLRGFGLIQLIGILLSLGWFDRVTIASLIPGHTHEDVDGMFSMLWKGLKATEAAKHCLTWPEMMRVAYQTYNGWAVPLASHNVVGKIQISEVSAVHMFQQLFGLGKWSGKIRRFQSTQNPKLKGFFGSGSDPVKKPHKFLFEQGETGPVATAFFTAASDSEVFFPTAPIFRSCPDILTIESADLMGPFLEQLEKVRAGLRAQKDPGKCGYSPKQVADYMEEPVQWMPPYLAHPLPVFTAADLAAGGAHWQLLERLGRPLLKGKHSRVNILEEVLDGDVELEEDEWAAIAARQVDEPDEDVEPSSMAENSLSEASDEASFEVERIMKVITFSSKYQQRELLVKWVGFLEPEPAWECDLPPNLIVEFDTAESKRIEEEMMLRRRNAFKEGNAGLEEAERQGKRGRRSSNK